MKRLVPVIGVVLISGGLVFGLTQKGDAPEPGPAEGAKKAEAAGQEAEEAAAQAIETGTDAFRSPYEEIEEHFNSYELPEEGLIPAADAVYENVPDPEKVAIYENGYRFDRKTKRMLKRVYVEQGQLHEPTAEQLTGVVMGLIAEAGEGERLSAAEVEARSEAYLSSVDRILNRLNAAKQYAEYEPLEQWIEKTINTFMFSKRTESRKERLDAYNAGIDRISQLERTMQ